MRFSYLNSPLLPTLAIVIYLLTIGLPAGHTLALIMLAGAGLWAALAARPAAGSGLSPVDSALLLFLLLSLLALLWAVDPLHTLEMELLLFPGLLLYYLVRSCLGLDWMPTLCLALTLQSLLIAVRVLYTAWGALDPDPTALMAEVGLVYITVPNDLLLLGLSSAFTVALACRVRTWSAVSGAAACLALTLAAIVIYRSNVALLALVLVVAGTLYSARPKVVGIVLAVLGGAIVAFDGLSGFALIAKFGNLQAWGNRIPLWLAAWEMFMDHPLGGVGPGGFSILADRYTAAVHLPDWVIPDPRHAPWAHNLYLETLAERGLLGFTALLLVLGRLLRIAWSYPKNGPARVYAQALGWSLVALLIAGLVEVSLLRSWVIALVALLAAIGSLLWRKPEQ